ncbi:hypothetical protein PPYR_15050 [Photinus pyralis]|uniref:MULE transposase domain-containing protein n=1 Tax=Photinus pyralis TaxID=7054 RepID=A0A5N3ZZQ2_PHOPY|nr:hypothetical protein PPYR_15050 [Photinus pyralis]
MDGTFKTVPHLFYQLLTVHGLKEKASIPLIYASLPSKSTECYSKFMQQIVELQPDVRPHRVTIDFEKAPINGFHRRLSKVASSTSTYVFFGVSITTAEAAI